MSQATDIDDATRRRELEMLAEEDSFAGRLARVYLEREVADGR